MSAATIKADHHGLKNPDGSWKYTNALARENSPYLLQHAHNPVDWHAWGPEAFEKARREQKPIFLSIGYSTCYWCHVMERQSFENPAIAAVMNEYFVNIKVDREERPDVDDLYMTATQMMTRRGGWPMSVFLTPPGAGGESDPGLKPYYAGTYFPPEPAHGMPGFPQLVEGLGKAWRERREDVLRQAETVADAVREQLEHGETRRGPVGVEVVQRAANQLLRLYDQEHGGFGGAPKFPTPAYLFFLLEVHRNNPDAQLWQAMSHTLDRMARGGMYDQVGGGFHRYSVDERWLVPHFEKMLYDNGQLVELYALALEHKPDAPEAAEQARVVRESCEYVLREMTDSTGAFWSAQDAEVNAREGGNYVWTREEVEAAIEDAELRELAVAMYGLDLGPNFEDPHAPDATPVNVLFLPRPLGQLAAERGLTYAQIVERRQQINTILKAVRDRREQPGTDDKTLVAWNGMMIAGLATAGRVLEEPRYVEAAGRAAEAVVRHMSELASKGGLLRSMRKGQAKIPAFLEDYAFFVHGLIALHRAQPGNSRWLHQAKSYTQVAQSRFEAPGGGYFDTLPDQADLFVRLRSVHDGAIPSGNAQMIHNLLDLHAITNDRAFMDRAVSDLRSFADELEQNGANMSYMQAALLRALDVAQAELAVGEAAEPASARASAVTVAVEPAVIDGARGEATLTLLVDVAEGYHINAPEVGDGLVPTTVELRGAEGVTLGVRFPPPEEKRFPFAEGRLRIYEGVVRLPVTLSWGETPLMAQELTLVVSYQACTDTACLVPQEAEVVVRVEQSAE